MNDRIRVAQLFYNYDIEYYGGVNRFAIELGKQLDRKRFDVIICGLGIIDSSKNWDRLKSLNEEGITAIAAAEWIDKNPYKSFINSQRVLNRYFTERPIDIIHSHSEFTDISALLLKAKKKVPKIMRTVHDGHRNEWHRRPWRRWTLTNFLFPIYYDLETGINQQNTDRLNRRYFAQLLGKRSYLTYNAIHLDRFKDIQINVQEKKASLGLPPKAPLIGSIGRLTTQKGYSFFLDAIEIILKRLPTAHFMIIGDGPLANQLKFRAKSMGVASQIYFTGSRPDIGELLKCMDIFVSSSLWEGLPTVILEAMTCKIPIVATDVPGSNELIKHGVNGYLVPPKDPDRMAMSILNLLNSSDIQQEFTQNALTTLDKFSMENIAREYEKLYEMIH